MTRTLARMGHTKNTKQEVAVAIRATNGLLTHTARALGCSYRTVQNYMNRWPDLRDIIYESKEKTLDISESMLLQGILKGNPNLIQFHLKTQAKHRGYVERTEDDGSRPIQVAIVLPQDFPKNLNGVAQVPSPLSLSKHPSPDGGSIGHDNMWDSSKNSIRESQRDEMDKSGLITQEPSEIRSETEEFAQDTNVEEGVSVVLGERDIDVSEENPNAGDVRAFLRYKTNEIWANSRIKVRKLSDMPIAYELEVIS